MSNTAPASKEPDFTPLNPEQLLLQMAEHKSPGTPMRLYLKAGQQYLHGKFNQNNIKELVNDRASYVDSVLQAAWAHFKLNKDENISLVAVGGYGRGELHPHSDVDILLLLAKDPDPECNGCIEQFITFLWDIGLEIGHSVRTLQECITLAEEDITIATNIMEARTLSGDADLLSQLSTKTDGTQNDIWTSQAFFSAKKDEQIGRHQKHNNTEYNLEPDIKNAPGGLRDIQMIGWVAKRHFSANSLHELTHHGFLTESEYQALYAGQNFLWEVRYALHRLTKRSENRLLFDHQRAIAADFGYKDSENNLAVEQFMKRYYRTAAALSQLNEMLLQYFDEAILHNNIIQETIPLDDNFSIEAGYILANDEAIFQEDPSQLLEIFVAAANKADIKGIKASTIRLITEHTYLIDDDFRNSATNNILFMRLLRSPYRLFTQLRRMKRYGVLGNYIPAFGKITGLMQYDLFHIYTVDAHTLLVLRNMRVFRHMEEKQRLPIAYTILQRTDKPEILYLAGLFHDIAKGRGGDHSELGAVDAMAFCTQHGIGRRDSKLICWLIANHLLMSMTAQRKDISDPEIIMDFARRVGDQHHLDFLYLLTVADINATNPSLWNGWRASLLRQLYTDTKRALRQGLENPIDKQEWIDETRDTAIKILHAENLDEEDIAPLWDNLIDDYFLRDTPADIAWHTEAILDHPASNGALVLIKETSGRQFEGATQIFIYTKDQANLFAATTNTLDQLGLTILDARIMTSKNDYSLDTYIVVEEDGQPLGENWQRIKEIKENLTFILNNMEQAPDNVQRRMARQLKHFDISTNVIISNSLNNDNTTVEVRTLDRPGLLAKVSGIFMNHDLKIQNARITTLGERAEDVFFISNQDNTPLSDPELCETIKNEIISTLDKPSKKES